MLGASRLSEEALGYKGLRHETLQDTVLATIINAKVRRLRKIEDEFVKLDNHRMTGRFSLYKAVAKPGRSYILECKQSSPSLGDFCKNFSLDALIEQYKKYARAISVLCEQDYFKGDITYLSYVKHRVNLPIICKDFIICKRQIDLAKRAGADALLLMLSVLGDDLFMELYEYAKENKLEVLTEVSDENEAAFAREHRLPLVGINNRNLKTLTIDFGTTARLAPLFEGTETLVISESGIKTHDDIISLKGVDGYLVGSSLCADIDNLNFNLKGLLFGFNKVCGIKDPDVLQHVIDDNLCFAGFIFYPKSPRYISVDNARALIRSERFRGKIKFVGVFVDESLVDIAKDIVTLKLEYVQLHGHEDISYIKALKDHFPKLKIIKAISVENEASLSTADDYAKVCDYLLLDSKNAGQNTSFEHSLLDSYKYAGKTLLAGGINKDNFKSAFEHHLAGVDLNSSLEREKGVKDCTLIDETLAVINAY